MLLLILIILMVPNVSKAASDSTICISQIESNLPDVTLFVRLENVDMDSAELKKNLSIKINNSPTQITSIRPVKNGNGLTENTAYLVLVDTSVSMQHQNQLSELQILLENLLGSVGPNDKTAIYGVSNTLKLLKDFTVTDSLESVTNNIKKEISLNSGTGTYLYSGIRVAYDTGRTAKDLPTRRIIVLITDGGVAGDCLSEDDLKNYMDVDSLPVYTLVLNHQTSIDEKFKNAAEQIAQTTGGQSFISTSGNELFTQFRASIEQGSIIKLRCDNFKALNLQTDMNVALVVDQKEIRQAAKFTATPALYDKARANNQRNLRTSYYGVAVILIPMILSLVMILASMWLLIKNKDNKNSQDVSDEIQLDQTPQSASTPESKDNQ